MNIRYRLIPFLAAAAVASLALATTGGVANASSAAGHARPMQARTTKVIRHLPGGKFNEVIISKVTYAAGSTIANGCGNDFNEDDLYAAPFNWPELAWFTMNTYFCWNGRIVTYHSTNIQGQATGPGSATGWAYQGTIASGTGWYCYVANGSTVNCSGNEEYAQGNFTDCVLKYGCIGNWQPYIAEWQNYKGGNGRNG